MEPFKNIFNTKSIKELAQQVAKYDKGFKKAAFLKEVSKELSKLELKDRVRLIAKAFNQHLSGNFKQNCKTLTQSLAPATDHEDQEWEGKSKNGITGFMVWPLCQYVEDYGLDQLEISMQAMYEMTQRFSAEFAIRPFIEQSDQQVFKTLRQWKKDPSRHVRRLVSEGTRPNLPWGMKVSKVNTNLKRNISLIYGLRMDDSLYVRRSVANHLNDISYHDENLFFETLERMGKSEKELWIKRHASRSMLKKGHPRALKLHGYNTNLKLGCTLKLAKKTVKEGGHLPIELSINLKKHSEEKLIIDYIIHFKKANDKLSPKVFRLRDTVAKDQLIIAKKIPFKKVTTRRHYAGEHKIEIQINGKKYASENFKLQL